MKKVLLILLPILMLCSACPQEKIIIQSQWKLVEQLADPGDGSGTFVAVDSDKTIDFLDDGTFTSNGDLCSMSTSFDQASSGTYDEGEGILYPGDCSLSDFKLTYEIVDDVLYLSYPCIEPCQQKYSKVE